MDRGINSHIRTDLEHKIVLLTGPRQSGKTTIAKSLFTSFDYLNMDNSMHMQHAINKYWDRGKQLLILDEFHKFKNWKRFIKGVYDTEGLTPKILITGSAKLDTYNKVGDSLAGRYFKYRLYPIDIQEACVYWENDPKAAFNRIMTCSGFPEPFLNGNTGYYKRWLKTHTEIILKQDLIDLTAVRSIKAIELSFVARNLLTLLKYTDNIDPEAGFSSLLSSAGIEGNSLPSTRTYGLNLNVKF